MTFSGNFMPPRFGADAKPKPKAEERWLKNYSEMAYLKAPQPNLKPASPQDGDGED